MRFYRPKKIARKPQRFASLPDVIVPYDGMMVVRWDHEGSRYALGYNPRGLFGEKLRKTRVALLRSMATTIEYVSQGRNGRG